MNATEATLTLRLLSEHEGVPATVVRMLASFIADGDTTYLCDGDPHGAQRPPVDTLEHTNEDGDCVTDLCSGYEGRVWVTPHLRETLLRWCQREYQARSSYSPHGVVRPMLEDAAAHAWLGFVP